jgi:hypothetical protein
VAQCPSETNTHWNQYSFVYFSLGNIDPNSAEGKQIVAASVAWNNADVNNNNSGVVFYQANAQNPAVVTFNNGTTATGVAGVTTFGPAPGGVLQSATITIGANTLDSNGHLIYDASKAGYSTAFQKNAEHEFGHTMGLSDVSGTSQVPGDTVMNQFLGTNDSGGNVALNPGTDVCDSHSVNSSTTFPQPPPPPPPSCCTTQNCSLRYTCNSTCDCQFSSPIIIDIEGEGFHLTSAEGGVYFDIGAMGYKQHVSWTDARYHNAFLVLDRNHDGVINDAKELFGSATPQPKSGDPNGFLALAVYDEPENGGNGDGVIDSRDAVWPDLRLWIDANHDGISQPDELVRLEDEGVYSIELGYKLTPGKDEFGNEFVYKGHVNARRKIEGDEVNRTIYDVILVLANPGRKRSCHDPKAAQLLEK